MCIKPSSITAVTMLNAYNFTLDFKCKFRLCITDMQRNIPITNTINIIEHLLKKNKEIKRYMLKTKTEQN